MSDINDNTQNWNNILKEFKLHLIPMLNPEGYLISTSAVRKLIPREMSQEEAEKISKKYYNAYRNDDNSENIKKEHMEMFKNVDYTCIPDKYTNIRESLKNIFEKYPDLPKNCLHIWSANANGIDVQANSKYNPKIVKILEGKDFYMSTKRHDNLNFSHPGPINCPFDKEKGFKEEKETSAISNLLDSLQKDGKLFAYLNYHSTGGIIFQRPAIIPENLNIDKENILKKQIINYMLAKTYQEKTIRNTGNNENSEKDNLKYIIYTKESDATSSNDIFRLKYPQNLLIELSGVGGNPIAPYADLKRNYENVIESNLEAVKYTLDIMSVAQMVSEAFYQVINKNESNINYELLVDVQDMIYKEFSKRVKTLQKTEKEEKEGYDR